MRSNVIKTCSSVRSLVNCLTAAEHSNLNVQKPNTWIEAEKLTAVSGTLNKDLLYSIYILLDVWLCSIAEYFYELCRILTSP